MIVVSSRRDSQAFLRQPAGKLKAPDGLCSSRLFSFLPGFSFCFSGAPMSFWGTERIFKIRSWKQGEAWQRKPPPLSRWPPSVYRSISSPPSGRPPARHLDSVSWRTTGFSRGDATTKGPAWQLRCGTLISFETLPILPPRTYSFISLFFFLKLGSLNFWISVFLVDEKILQSFIPFKEIFHQFLKYKRLTSTPFVFCLLPGCRTLWNTSCQ